MELHPILERDTCANNALWYVVSATGESPSMRVGLTCAQLDETSTSSGKLYVVGGANPSGSFNDVCVLDLDTFQWDVLEVPGLGARYEHAMFVPESEPDKIYIFGGANQTGNLNDVQVLDTTRKVWSGVLTEGAAPVPRTHHTSAAVGDRLVIYSGGQNGPDPVGDRQVHVFDAKLKTWSTLSLSGDPPKPRHGHVMVAVGHTIFIHGGMAGTTFYDDLHMLDMDRMSWRSMKKKKMYPCARAAHGGIAHSSDIFIFGGMGKEGALDDMYNLNTETSTWCKLELHGPPPACRLDFGICSVRLKMAANQGQGDSELVSTSKVAKETVDNQLSMLSLGTPPKEMSPIVSRQGSASSQNKSPEINVKECDLSSGACATPTGENSQDAAARSDIIKQPVDMCLIIGGMDTQGEIFDDCLVYKL